jgi:hypothetical protein
MPLPDDVNINCQYQQVGMGTLICEAADLAHSQHATNEVDDEICFKCPVGKINRELGCNKISGKIEILLIQTDQEELKHLDEVTLWCNLRKRKTSYEYCLTCPYIGTQFSVPILMKTLDYFEKLGFGSAKDNLEKARERLLSGDPESSITNSISAVESAFKSILDMLKEPYPTKEQITTLWKSVKNKLHLGDEISSEHLINLLGNLSGCMGALGGLRNDLSDAHGKGLVSPSVYDSYAELALNLSAAICLFIIRRYQEFITEQEV